MARHLLYVVRLSVRLRGDNVVSNCLVDLSSQARRLYFDVPYNDVDWGLARVIVHFAGVLLLDRG